jgi:hypothetical protein
VRQFGLAAAKDTSFLVAGGAPQYWARKIRDRYVVLHRAFYMVWLRGGVDSQTNGRSRGYRVDFSLCCKSQTFSFCNSCRLVCRLRLTLQLQSNRCIEGKI